MDTGSKITDIGDIKKLVTVMDEELAVSANFDILKRELEIGGRYSCFYLIDGFSADAFVQKLLQFLCELKPEDMPDSFEEMQLCKLPAGEVTSEDKLDNIYKAILSGQMCMLIEGYSSAILVDSREYPARSVSEPDKDKVLRGSKDSFVETLVFNCALIRRRIRSTKLRIEAFDVGESSHTDVAVCYMSDRVDERSLNIIKQKLQAVINSEKIDSLSMNQESLAESLYKKSWWNPFPKYKYTERADVTAASMLEGSIAILVDNSPLAMIIPTTLFDIVEEANDYYFPPITGTYLRLSRFIINIFTLITTPLFLLLMQNPDFIPESLRFIMIKETVNVPLIWQFIILEFAVDGMKMAAINTPTMLTTPLSVIAGLVIGEFAVSSGWFNSEPMLYMAGVTIANYSQVNYELGYALKFMRMLLLIFTALFNVWGFAAGIVVVILAVSLNKTLTGRRYLYPLIPFNPRQLARMLFRLDIRKVVGKQQ